MPFRHPVIERLAADHDAHLRWLKGRCGATRSDSDLEDALQRAFAKAIEHLDANPAKSFASNDKACAWFHTIAERVVYDDNRHEKGRRESERASRPQLVSMYTEEGPRPLVDPGLDVESEVIERIHRTRTDQLIRRVLDAIPAEHRQVLKLLYGHNYSAAEIMHLLGIERGQWDGRRRRALLAFVRALARHDLTPQCAHARKLVKRDPHRLLAGLDADGHFNSCLPCRAFQHSAKSALAIMPLPIAIPAIKFDTLQYFARKANSAADAASSSSRGVSDSFIALKGSLGYKLAFAAITSTLAVAGVIGAFAAHQATPALPNELSSGPARKADQARWAAHETDRQALERAARDLARTRTR